MEKKEFKLSLELINGVFGYLGSRPYVEVAKLIQELEKELNAQTQEAPKQEE